MFRANTFTAACLVGVAIAMTASLADAQPAQGTAVGSGGMMYGSQLMTPAERNEYRTRMLAAKSDAEREKIRAQHHAEMQKRAKARGITLPDVPPMRGMHRGQGMGMGMGPGYMHGQPGGPASGAAGQ
ncbi:hypothetical protein C5615_29730 [Burkholderia cepacia]|uniref:DUF4148 domain-containing protein n=1 Tax=Burkholderia cepacia TaxID=292 RepID=A0A2S8IEE3_BURCE|nr:hypothetical protein [Burkholderia cepacia]PQP13130.1 hypothetical protein C5615_29730 [Burkholderia cepacia]HDR9510452.1 hypothetical protein [Burkholderia cepacia]